MKIPARQNFGSTLQRVGFLLALLLMVCRSHAAIRDGGIDPQNMGRGSWIYILPDAINGLRGNVPSVNSLSNLMTYMKNQGLQYVGIKAAQADTVFTVSGNPQFTSAVVAAGHAAGLKVFGYIYTTGQNVPGEIAMVDYIFQQGADGLIYDAESEWESQNLANNAALAVQLCSTVRSNWPNKFMGLSTWPYREFHSSLPYKEFAYYCDVIMPQAYWIELGDTPTVCVTHVNDVWNSWKSTLTGVWTNAIKPFIMTGQGWSSVSGTVTTAQITEFENALRTIANPVSPGGFKAVDYWRAELHPASIWDAIRTNFLANLYTNAPVIQVAPVITVSATTAGISWPTDQNSDSVVEYGLSTSYGNATTNATLLWYHTVNLSGLAADTTYHYRVKSKNVTNQVGVSADYVFTTLVTTVGDVIVESRLADGSLNSNPPYADSIFANSTLKSTVVGLTGSGSRYAFNSASSITVKPALAVAGGTYDVYLTHGSVNASADLIMAVGQSGCAGLPATTVGFQQSHANSWENVGRMTLNSGVTVPTITYTYSGGTLNSGTARIYSDAFKFVYVPPLPTAPLIATPPGSLTVNQGNTATFFVSASGTAPLVYQWKHAGTNLPGATTSSYTKLNAQPADAGTYVVTITNSFGATNSANATLTVNLPPSIFAQPQSTNVNPGVTVAFTVTATGSPTPTYQWRFNGTNLAGAIGTSYTLNSVQPTDAGNYSVVVSNIAGSMTSGDAVLTVIQSAPPHIDSITLLLDRRAQLQISGGPGNFAIEQAPSLSGWTQAFTTNVISGVFLYTDPETNQLQRFYRAQRLVP